MTYYWLQAEYAQLNGEDETASEAYENAINFAMKYGYINYVAIIAERTYEFYIKKNRLICAKSYYQLALTAYQRWGATKKCRQLEQHNAFEIYHSKLEMTDIMPSGGLSSSTLDLRSIMNANLILSSEINLEKLLEKILFLVLQNAGAQIGALIFKEKKGLELVALAKTNEPTVVNLAGESLEMTSAIPLSIVNYVDRVSKPLILNNSNAMINYHNDEYIRIHNPQSILCLPIINHGIRIGYLYLENRISEEIFSNDRLDLLKLLSGEIAISIENAKLYSAIGRFVPHQLLQQLNKDSIVEVQRGDHIIQNMSILFCDINKFTTISEKLSPELTFKMINFFLAHMEPIINKHHGFIDKYIGDAIMALFHSPDCAVSAGLDILEQLVHLNMKLVSKNLPKIKVGVGINTGNIMVGIIGGKDRIEGTVLGDAVNIASRLEGLTRHLDTNILISNATKVELSENLFNFIEIGNVTVKGKKNVVLAWSVSKANN